MFRNSIFGNEDSADKIINNLIVDEALYRSKAIKAGKDIVKLVITKNAHYGKVVAQELFNCVMEKGLPTLHGCYDEVTDKTVAATHFGFPAERFSEKITEKFKENKAVKQAFKETIAELMPQHINRLAQNNFLRYLRHLLIKLQETFSSSRNTSEKNAAFAIKQEITNHKDYNTLIQTFVPKILTKFSAVGSNGYQQFSASVATTVQKQLLTKIFATIAVLYGKTNTVRVQENEPHPWESHWDNIKSEVVRDGNYSALPNGLDFVTIFLDQDNTYSTLLTKSRGQLTLTGATEADKLVATIEKLHNKRNQIVESEVAQNNITPNLISSLFF